jgi:hypothetical protein
LQAGDPNGEVDLAWQCYQQLRCIYHATTAEGRRLAEKVIASFPSCPIPEVARLAAPSRPGANKCSPTSTPTASPTAARSH